MLPLHQGIVYGPVRSRRLGLSLGINVLPRHQKVCTFNCSYCQYGWTHHGATSAADTWPDPAAVARAAETALARLDKHGDAIQRLTLAGHGEPTLHPQFVDVVDALVEMRDRCAPRLPLAILSNSSTLGSASVAAALERLDERYMKLDAGDATLLRRVNATTLPFDTIVANLRRLPAVVVQAMFVRDRLGRIDNAGDLAVATWIAAVKSIEPRGVHIYTIDREPAWPYLQPIAAPRLLEIARRAQTAGLPAEAFVAPGTAASGLRG